jgi:DNA-binding transcriptional regulator LsrR (DeoR family)
VRHLNSDVRQQQIEWRRSQVLELSSEGYNQREIAQKVQIDKSAVNSILRKQARENLQYHIHDRIPEEYQNCMIGMKQNLKQTLEIAETTLDPRTKLQARAIANDCYKYIMELTTNGVVITDSIKFVQTNKEKLTILTDGNKGSKESKEPDFVKDKERSEEK